MVLGWDPRQAGSLAVVLCLKGIGLNELKTPYRGTRASVKAENLLAGSTKQKPSWGSPGKTFSSLSFQDIAFLGSLPTSLATYSQSHFPRYVLSS